MVRPSTKGLTENELLVMKILWAEAPLTVSQIIEKLPRTPKPAYTSVLTLVQTMEKKRYVRHAKVGKAYVYSPVLKKKTFEKKAVIRAAKEVFDGDPLTMAMGLIKNEHLSKNEIDELKRLLEDM